MFVVVKMGGCNGSGKTSVARGILEHMGAVPCTFKGAAKSPNYYVGTYKGVEVVVLGSYETACGGMDTISDKLQRLDMVQKMCKPGRIVFFEGLITGKTYGAFGELSETHVNGKKGLWLYTFMDTPFEVCVERVLQRRAQADRGGKRGELDPERTLRPTYESCASLLRKIRGVQRAKIGPQPMAHPTLELNHKKKPAVLAQQVLDAAVEMFDAGR